MDQNDELEYCLELLKNIIGEFKRNKHADLCVRTLEKGWQPVDEDLAALISEAEEHLESR